MSDDELSDDARGKWKKIYDLLARYAPKQLIRNKYGRDDGMHCAVGALLPATRLHTKPSETYDDPIRHLAISHRYVMKQIVELGVDIDVMDELQEINDYDYDRQTPAERYARVLAAVARRAR